MTKQEQIEEILEVIKHCGDYTDRYCSDCDYRLYGHCNNQKQCEAKALYNAGYRKVSDGAVVLTPEERDDEMKATNEILAERDDLKEKVESLKSEKEGWKMRYSDSGQKNKKLSIKNAQLKAENEQLKAKLEARLTCNFVKTAQKHAVQEFAEKLKRRLKLGMYEWQYAQVDVKTIEDLLKEYEDD